MTRIIRPHELGDDDRREPCACGVLHAGPCPSPRVAHGPKRSPWDTAPRLTGENVAEYFAEENEGARVTRGELKFFLQRLATEQVRLGRALPQLADAAVEAGALVTAELIHAQTLRGRLAHGWRRARARLAAWTTRRARP